MYTPIALSPNWTIGEPRNDVIESPMPERKVEVHAASSPM